MHPRALQCFVPVCAAALSSAAWAEILTWRSDLPGTWIDATDGIALNLTGDDVRPITSPVGNAVFAAGTWQVGNNGAIGFGPSQLLPPVTEPIPTRQIFEGGQSVAPFADDIGNEIGNVYMKVVVPRRGTSVIVIEWFMKRFEGHPDTGTFEVQIFSDPGANRVYAQMLYQDIQQSWPNGGEIATIGYQNGAAGFNNAQWSYHVVGAVYNGLVLTLVPEPGAATCILALCLARLRKR
ncbi:MAG: hypothetical protein AB1716_14565 [Planctomycetota bacterium]